MMSHVRSVVLALLAVLVPAPRAPAAGEGSVPALADLAALMPADTFFYAEVRGGDALWTDFRKVVWPRIEASPLGAALRADEKFLGLIGGLSAFELASQKSAEAQILNVLGEGIALGVAPSPGQAKPRSWLVMRARDPEMARQSVRALAELMKKPLPASDGRAPLLLPLEDGAHLGVIGALVAITSDLEAFERLSERVRDAAGPGAVPDGALADQTGFREARAHHDAAHFGFAFADTAALARLKGGGALVPESADNPLGQLLLGRLLLAFNASRAVALDARIADRALELETRLLGAAPACKLAAAFTNAPPPRPAPAVGNGLLSLSARRDFPAWWAMREDVLDPALAPQLVEFETNMGVLFGGKPFADLLARLDGDAHFVLARQVFAPRVPPTVRYPAGALILTVKDEKALWPQVLVAFQNALGFVNADRGQKGEPQLLLEIGAHRDVPIATARYLEEMASATPSDDGPLPMHHNVKPACGVVKGELVLSSSDALLRDLIDAVLDGRRETASDALETLSVNGRGLRKILAENEAPLVTQNMLEKGHGKAKAEREMGALLGLVGLFDDAQITTRAGDGELRVSLRLRLRRGELVQSDAR